MSHGPKRLGGTRGTVVAVAVTAHFEAQFVGLVLSSDAWPLVGCRVLEELDVQLAHAFCGGCGTSAHF